jgi:hypothetical protein
VAPRRPARVRPRPRADGTLHPASQPRRPARARATETETETETETAPEIAPAAEAR